MRFPALDDTIVAVASQWSPAPVGILRISGPRAHALAATLGARLPPPGARYPLLTSERIDLGQGLQAPAEALWFKQPRSYTGQDLVELHTLGALPILQRWLDQFVALGARSAAPGEFTARAFQNHRMAAGQVTAVLDLLRAEDDGAARLAARRLRAGLSESQQRLAHALTELLARVEAGIDFVEEEDVRFITAAELRSALRRILTDLPSNPPDETPARDSRPHVALMGRPNAGKSTLLNTLTGFRRAIVAPIKGTTRDVLTCEAILGGTTVILQDTAGLGETAGELDASAQQAALSAGRRSDLILWLHDGTTEWGPEDSAAFERQSTCPRILVWTKADLRPAGAPMPPAKADSVAISAITGEGLSALRSKILSAVSKSQGAAAEASVGSIVRGALERAVELLGQETVRLPSPELLAIELRSAIGGLQRGLYGDATEAVLAEIYTKFCVGK